MWLRDSGRTHFDSARIDDTSTNIRVYRPDLDGLRAVAVYAVILSHHDIWWARGGWMGVDLFFVLSGFLITRSLLGERATSGSVHLRSFYARRVLRLYPALIAMLLLGLLTLGPAPSKQDLSSFGISALLSGFYLMDFVRWICPSARGPFGHTWSLAIEEQFYLLWPALFMYATRHKDRAMHWAIGLACGSYVLLATLPTSGANNIPDTYFLPWTRMGTLLIGCALALYLDKGVRLPEWFHDKSTGITLSLSVLCFMYIGAAIYLHQGIKWQVPAIAAFASFLIMHLEVSQDRGIKSLLSARPLAEIGRRSYGIYLYFPLMQFFILLAFDLPAYAVAFLTIVLTTAVASASYRYIELPFLRYKSNFHSERSRTA